MFTKNDLEQIENQGLTLLEVENQISTFSKGFALLKLISPAIPQNGIEILSDEEVFRYIIVYENFLLSGLKAMKFVPASGAASRMFINLFDFLEKTKDEKTAALFIENDAYMSIFFSNIERFAFYNMLKTKLDDTSSKIEIIKKILFEEGLGYGFKPKGQIVFHKYNEEVRTPFEEHLVETISFCTCSDGYSKVHFTVSPEHLEGFENLLKFKKSIYQKRYGIQLDVSFSFQHKSTNTIAVDHNNHPYKSENGQLVFRPGGHGALLQNLGDLDADIIFIKNIDNVVPDRLKTETKQYKKALAGLLVSLRSKIFDYSEKLDQPTAIENNVLITKIELFVHKELKIKFENNFSSQIEKVMFLKNKLNRPIRICGMVKNAGEPGGGPFWTQNSDGTVSLQIVEKAQIDLNNQEQVEFLNQSTHFNPVDLICSIKDYKGNKFNLIDYSDQEAGFISVKTKDGKEIKALEYPGLWNGSMSNWTTIFVEVPTSTFNPVKTVNDLLRTEHH